jgi:hypothetical protein
MRTETKKLVYVASFLALTMMITSAASAYVLLSPARRWFSTPKALTVDSGGVASVTDSSNGVSACVSGSNSWNGSGVNVINASSGNVVYSLGDNRSDMIFSDPLHICTGTCLAATTTGYYDSNQTGVCTHPDSSTRSVVAVTDADVAFNLNYDYTTPSEPDGCSSEIYIDSVAAHEVGHVIGLGHSNTSSALMYASVAYCSHKVVSSDDTNGRNELYNCTSFTTGGGGGCGGRNASCSANSQCCSGVCKANGRCR